MNKKNLIYTCILKNISKFSDAINSKHDIRVKDADIVYMQYLKM